MEPQFVPIDVLYDKQYNIVLDYPRADPQISAHRISTLYDMGVDRISFTGGLNIRGLNILGKGHAGMVVLARSHGTTLALKIKRADSVRDTMIPEAKLLQKANEVDVGPRLLKYSTGIIAMEYLNGPGIGEWILNIASNAVPLKRVIRHVLKSCFRLDSIGLDHGELANISKHVIVGDTTTLIDFESSSLNRRPANVTTATQGMYVNSAVANKIRTIYDSPKPSALIPVLRAYKHRPTPETFQNLLDVLLV